MRTLVGVAVVCALTVTVHPVAQDRAESPNFRSRVDLITIDVAAVDGQGNPVPDLSARDFEVKVDGKSRRVVSAELVRVDAGAPAPLPPPPPGATVVTSNLTATPGRLVIVAVDQTMIRPGGVAPLLRTAGQFVDTLAPSDYASFVAFPAPGPYVEFTTDKARVRDAMQGVVVGHVRKTVDRRLDMSLTESFDINNKERTFATSLGTPEEIWQTLGPALRRVLERGCGGMSIEELMADGLQLSQCVRDATAEAIINQNDARSEGRISLAALEEVLAGLVPVPGHKSMVLLSAGLVAEDLSVLDEVTRLAAAARTSITVISVDPERDEVVLGQATRSSTGLQDRSLELQALDTIAERTGGRLVRASGGTGQGIFERIAREQSAWYTVAIERDDRDSTRQRVEVSVRQPGVTIRSNRRFISPAALNAGRSPEDRLRDALSSPLPDPGLPLRLATFVRRDPSGKFRLQLAAEVGQPVSKPAELSIGYVVLNNTRTVTGSVGKRQLAPAAQDIAGPLQFDMTIAIDPGTYSLRVGAVDAEGRLGTVVRPLQLAVSAGEPWVSSDLLVGSSSEGGDLRHAVEPVVDADGVSAYLELYPPASEAEDVSVSLEIANAETSPTLAAGPMSVGAGTQPQSRLAYGTVDLALAPGRYVARATVRRDGKVLRVLTRSFTLARSARATASSARSGGSPMSAEFRQRTAAHVATVLNGLAQIVAQEDFDISGRRLLSDFLLVRYPGSQQDLLSFRDVIRVNGRVLPDRETRLTQLFLEPPRVIADRVREIREASESYVSSSFNPIFVLAFLQAGTQSRFDFTVADAGAEWPRDVKEVTFVETARPTLIRSTTGGDVPVRGTAWIEESTGRVLRGDIRLGDRRSAMGVSTTFRFDETLQITVPAQMRTRNPDGEATYSNLRRFSVQTEETIEDAK